MTTTDCVVLGIDPGLDGGWSVYSTEDRGLVFSAMPTRPGHKGGREIDVSLLHQKLNQYAIQLAAVELVHAMPGQGVRSCFTFGRNYGAVLAVLEILNIPIQHVTPQRWKKTVLDGLGTDKAAAIRWCQSRFPGRRFVKSEKASVPHDGICDAVCLAEMARIILMKGTAL